MTQKLLNPGDVDIQRDGKEWRKMEYVRDWVGDKSGRTWQIGSKYYGPTENGPWNLSTEWMREKPKS